MNIYIAPLQDIYLEAPSALAYMMSNVITKEYIHQLAKYLSNRPTTISVHACAYRIQRPLLWILIYTCRCRTWLNAASLNPKFADNNYVKEWCAEHFHFCNVNHYLSLICHYIIPCLVRPQFQFKKCFIPTIY